MKRTYFVTCPVCKIKIKLNGDGLWINHGCKMDGKNPFNQPVAQENILK